MKNTLLASVALFLLGSVSASVAMPTGGLSLSATPEVPALHFVKDGGDDNGSDDNGGDDNGGGRDDDNDGDDNGGRRGGGNDDGAGHDANDDHGGLQGGHGADDVADDSNDDNAVSGSNRRKPRVPGGSGCDDASDAAEHAECRSVAN